MSKLNKSISQIWSDDYVVPLYQRNYAWQESQIQQLLQDVYDNSKITDSHYFIDSLEVDLLGSSKKVNINISSLTSLARKPKLYSH